MNRTASIARTILVVDDDSALRNTLIEILEEEGYRASSASNGQEALDALRRQGPQPSLILLDMMMPVMDGWAFREEQQKDQTLCGIPVVIFSAQGNVREMAASVSAAAYLKKPLLLKELLELVDRFCGEGALSA